MVFVADDLAAWLIGLLADAGRKKLASVILGDEQERALRSAARSAVQLTAEELCPQDAEQAEHVAIVISHVFSEPLPGARLGRQATMLEALGAGIGAQLAVLDDASLTGTGQSSSEVPGVARAVVSAKLTGHLVREIVVRGSRGGPLSPLASQLNDDVTHLQGQRLEEMLGQLVIEVREALTQAGDIWTVASGGVTPRTAAAQRDLISAYLKVLIDWLNSDPWPRDRRFSGPMLSPAALERRLRVTATGVVGETDLDADDLARRCSRLVVLGGPGSGKTWLAKRVARRCAERAFEALASGASFDDVELPLFTTCSWLVGAEGSIREAAVSSALDHIGDLGNFRLRAALHAFMTRRNAPTLLVIDSLDEAHGAGERLRQADTLPWRIVLTSRPGSWNRQLDIHDNDGSHRIGELRPLSYPRDIESFIQNWFASRPELGLDLTSQIARRDDLQQAAAVPLILAFCCIIGGNEPLPRFRRDLNTKVLRRILTGRWRGDDGPQADPDACLRTLRAWAWSGATAHPISGVGTWADDIPAGPVQLGQAEQDGLDHVATPLGPPDVDTGATLRRFIHRLIREHLVAEHVAGLPVDQAAEVLLPHLWYDRDWEYVVPAALAMHPQRDRLLRGLICRAAMSREIPDDVAVVDGCWEFRKLLIRTAAESSPADWSAEIAEMIGQAHVELANYGHFDAVTGAASWEDANREVCGVLLALLGRRTDDQVIDKLVEGVARLTLSAWDKREARKALLGLLPGQTNYHLAGKLAAEIIRLDPTAQDRRQAREALLALLAPQTIGRAFDKLMDGVTGLTLTIQDRQQAREALLGLLPGQTDYRLAAMLATGITYLDPTTEDRRQAREALLSLFADAANSRASGELVYGIVRLAPAAEDKLRAREALLRLLTSRTHDLAAGALAQGVIQLDPTAEDKRQVREVVLGLLTSQVSESVDAGLATYLAALDPTTEDRQQARDALLQSLADPTDIMTALDAVTEVVRLALTAEDKLQAREALLRLLTSRTHDFAAGALAQGVMRLDPTAEDKRQARNELLRLLAGQTGDWLTEQLIRRLIQLVTGAKDKREAREVLLGRLAGESNNEVAWQLMEGAIQLAPDIKDKRQTRETLLGMLADQTDVRIAEVLAQGMTYLAPEDGDTRKSREILLQLLARQTDAWTARGLASWLDEFDPTAEDKGRAREALLCLLVDQTDYLGVEALLHGLAKLDPTAEDKRQARKVLLALLAHQTDIWPASSVAEELARLNPTAQDKHQAREILLGLLTNQTPTHRASRLADAISRLDPTVSDLRCWLALSARPTAGLLTSIRRNSALSEWLETLPTLTGHSVLPMRKLLG